MNAPRPRRVDYTLLALTLLLLAAGTATMYSASAVMADRQFGSSFYFLKRQALFLAVGLPLLATLARVHYQRLREWTRPILLVTAILLVAVLFGPRVAGVKRWFKLGPFGVQPAEFAKLTIILFLADYLDRKRSRLDSPIHGVFVPLGVVGTLLGLIALEPDLGTPALLFVVTVMLLYIGGTRLKPWPSPPPAPCPCSPTNCSATPTGASAC